MLTCCSYSRPFLFGLSFLSGMLGLGVAFVAIPVLGLFGYDLKNVIQPWALLLNGLTAISGAIAFWRAGMALMTTRIAAANGMPAEVPDAH